MPFHQGNAWPRTTRMILQSVQNQLEGKNIKSVDGVKMVLEKCFSLRRSKLWKRDIERLPERPEKNKRSIKNLHYLWDNQILVCRFKMTDTVFWLEMKYILRRYTFCRVYTHLG
ncbi:hypothetical protein AMK59_1366, partial [Oryctes borbonicus]